MILIAKLYNIFTIRNNTEFTSCKYKVIFNIEIYYHTSNYKNVLDK